MQSSLKHLLMKKKMSADTTGPILESKGMGAIFQKNGKTILKKGKVLGNLGKNIQNLNIF